MRSTAEGMIPIRVGGWVPHGSLVCIGCGGDCATKGPHVQPRLRFTLLAWVPVLTEEHARAHNFPYFGSSFDPPIEVAGVRADPSDNEAQQYVRYMYWN